MSAILEPRTAKTTDMVRDYGDCALLVECADTTEVLSWTELLQRAELPGVVDIVPGARTVLIKLAGPRYQSPTRQRLGRQRPHRQPGDHRPPGGHVDVVIDVVYDGADLVEVGRLTGLDTVGVIAAHTGTPGGSDSVDSHRVSPTSSTATHDCRCPAGPSPEPRSPPVRSRWPVSSAPSIRDAPRAAGN